MFLPILPSPTNPTLVVKKALPEPSSIPDAPTDGARSRQCVFHRVLLEVPSSWPPEEAKLFEAACQAETVNRICARSKGGIDEKALPPGRLPGCYGPVPGRSGRPVPGEENAREGDDVHRHGGGAQGDRTVLTGSRRGGIPVCGRTDPARSEDGRARGRVDRAVRGAGPG